MSQELAKLQNVGEYTGISLDATDDKLIEMWLDGRPDNTVSAYRRDIALFRDIVKKPIQAVMLEDLQKFSRKLTTEKESSKSRTRNAIKSLFTLAMKLGYIRMNPAAAWITPKVLTNLAARIITQEDVMMMLAKEENPRNHAILRLIYSAGLRVSELCKLTWADVQPNATTGGQVTVVGGKGKKTRSIPISARTYEEILSLRTDKLSTSPVFPSPHGPRSLAGLPLTRTQMFYIVEAAAVKAGIALYTDEYGSTRSLLSPHWLRHAHASHALDEGASIILVRDTLGHASVETTNKYAHARPNASSSTYLKV